MPRLSGTTGKAQRLGHTVVKTVKLSAGAGGAATLNLYNYGDENGDSQLLVNAAVSSDTQLSFEGLEFPSGVSVVSSTNASQYILEYE